jgi:HEAT repeat protein
MRRWRWLAAGGTARASCGRVVGAAGLVVLSQAGAAGGAPVQMSNASAVLAPLMKQAEDRTLPEAERLEIIRILGDWASPETAAPLLAALSDPSEQVRAAAARGLGWRGNRAAIPALRERAEATDEKPEVRAWALRSLAGIEDESIRDVLLAATRDADPTVRGAAYSGVAFGPLARPADRLPLLRRVAEDRGLDLQTRCEAILVLGATKDQEAVDVLMNLLEHEPAVPMPLPRPRATQQEIMAVRHRQARDVRAWAAQALGVLEARPALPLLLKSAEDKDDFFLRVTSLTALVAWNAPEAKPVYIRRLKDRFPDVRTLALTGLAKTGDQGVVDAVAARLSDNMATVRAQAVLTLAELGDGRVRPQLEEMSKKELDPDVQQALESALDRLAP